MDSDTGRWPTRNGDQDVNIVPFLFFLFWPTVTISSWSTSHELLQIFGDQLADIGHPAPDLLFIKLFINAWSPLQEMRESWDWIYTCLVYTSCKRLGTGITSFHKNSVYRRRCKRVGIEFTHLFRKYARCKRVNWIISYSEGEKA